MPASSAMSRVRVAENPFWVKSLRAASLIFSSVEDSFTVFGFALGMRFCDYLTKLEWGFDLNKFINQMINKNE